LSAVVMCVAGGVLEIPFNVTVQTRGLLEADDEKLASESSLGSHSQLVNHSRTLRCSDEVQIHSQHPVFVICQR